jgi:hypothetical protein
MKQEDKLMGWYSATGMPSVIHPRNINKFNRLKFRQNFELRMVSYKFVFFNLKSYKYVFIMIFFTEKVGRKFR